MAELGLLLRFGGLRNHLEHFGGHRERERDGLAGAGELQRFDERRRSADPPAPASAPARGSRGRRREGSRLTGRRAPRREGCRTGRRSRGRPPQTT